MPPVSLTPVANLPPAVKSHAELVAKFAAGEVDNGGKFAAGVVDNGGNFATGVIDTGGKFATVVHLFVRISPRIFEKIRNDSNIIFKGLGEGDS